jgi:hypothetical protein
MLSWMVYAATSGTFVALVYVGLGLLALAACGRRPWPPKAQPRERRHRLVWLTLSMVLFGLGAVRLQLASSVLPWLKQAAHEFGWRKPAHLPRSALAAAGLLGLGGAAAGFLAARRSPSLLGACASALLLAALAGLRLLSSRFPAGRIPHLATFELAGLGGVTVSAAWAAGWLSRARRRTTVGVAGALAGVLLLAMAGVGFARGRPSAPTAATGRAPADAVGGGFTAGGLDGDYFANAELRGPPAFARRDVRIDFDWPRGLAPGGSVSPDFARAPADRFSARWTGKVIARFSEPYTFEVDADDGARLSWRRPGADQWTVAIDKWTASGRHRSAPITLQAGVPVEVRLEYRQAGGGARVRLSWSAKSVPQEIIEPLSRSGTNVGCCLGYLGSLLYADAMKGGRTEWTEPDNDKPVPLDENGWPLRDAANIVFEGARQTRGTYRLSFEGQAELATFPNDVAIQAGGGAELHGLLPKGSGYDARSNTTRATLRLDSDSAILILRFRKTERTPGAPAGGGVRNVRLMRPVAPGAAESYPPGTLFDRALEESFSGFTALRWILNFDKEAHWADRRRPSQAKGLRFREPATWEHVVMLANETGRDLYVCTPINADDDYLQRLARLFRFGSDARGEPYASPRANPVYPPLNPNLRVYLERSNEVWNWAFGQAGDNQRQAADAVASDSANGRIVNFDHAVGATQGGDLWRRWHALRTKQLADTFRLVYGDQAMGPRVRILYEYQYNDEQGTASEGLSFLDRYFNNADGDRHVSDPRPVNQILWGAGGAVYYGSGNPTGKQTAVVIPDGGFEQPRGASPWKFEGTAGLYRISLADALHLRAPGPESRALGPVMGVRFRTGARPLAIYEVGRWAGLHDKQTHAVRILRAGDRQVAVSADVHPAPNAMGPLTIARLSHPVLLSANTEYWLVSDEQPDGDRVHAAPAVDPDPSLQLEGALLVKSGSPDDPASWRLDEAPGAAAGPATFRFAIAPASPVGFPPAPEEGQQAAFLGAKGAVSTTIDFGKGGTFAVQVRVAGQPDAVDPIDFELDGRRVTSYPDGRDPRVSPEPFVGGRWAYDVRDLLRYTSAVFPAAGPHRFRVVGRGRDGQAAYLDDLSVVSVDAIFDGGMPALGEATGQRGIDDYAKQVESQARYAQAFGLRTVAYEGGWSVGGDFESTALQSAAKYLDPRAEPVQTRALRLVEGAGYGLILWGTYDLWPAAFESPARASRYPLMKSILESDDQLPAEAAGGSGVPGEIDPATFTWAWPGRDQGRELGHPGDLVSYRILVPATGAYDLTVGSDGWGTLELLVDGGLALSATGPGGRPLIGRGVLLPKGMHTITLRSTKGALSIRAITVAAAA